MLCSRCSEPCEPVVALDIDGTLADWHSHFIAFANRWIGYTPPEGVLFRGGERFRDWMCDTYGIDHTTFRAIKLAYRQSGLKRDIPLHPGADAMINVLRRQGVEVWLTTTRPHDRYDRLDPDTVEWARRNRLAFDGLLFDEDKIGALARRIDPERMVAVLDDLPWVLERVREERMGEPMLIQMVHNEEEEWDGVRAGSLPHALFIMTQMVQRWREAA